VTTHIYLIRHGQTELSVEDRFYGITEVDLSAAGRRQAACLAQRLANDDIAAFYCSTLRRTVETATILSAPHQMRPNERAGLGELHFGHWETMLRQDVATQFAAEYAAWQQDPFTIAPQGGESGAEVLARALPVMQDIIVHHDGQTVVVVCHKSTIRLMLCSWLGMDPRFYRDRLGQLPAALNILDFEDAVRARLLLFNDVSHYVNEQHPADATP
jgi:probable phosphoglycerate mutase